MSDAYEMNTSLVGANVTAIPFSFSDLACVRVSVSDVSIDCKGFDITNDGSGDFGILLLESGGGSLTNVTVKNCIISDYNNSGLLIFNTTDSVFMNITSFDNGGDIAEEEGIGVWLRSSDDNNLSGITSYGNTLEGILFDPSDGNSLTSSNSSSNRVGITVQGTDNNISNNFAQENLFGDLFVNPLDETHCDNIISNLTGSGSRPVNYTNESVNWSDFEASQIVLCDADDSILDNITISGSDSISNNGMFLVLTDDATITNSNSSGNMVGFFLSQSSNNTIMNSTANNNSIPPFSDPLAPPVAGFMLLGSSGNILVNNIASDNEQFGFLVGSIVSDDEELLVLSSENVLDGNTASFNELAGFAGIFTVSNIFANDVAFGNNPSNNMLPIGDPDENGSLPLGGFFFLFAPANVVINATAYDNRLAGLTDLETFFEAEPPLPAVPHLVVSDSHFFDNDWEIIQATIFGNSFTVSNTKLGNDSVVVSLVANRIIDPSVLGDITLNGYMMNETTDPSGGSPPSGLVSFNGKYLKIGPLMGAESANLTFLQTVFHTLTFHWNDTEAFAFNESTLRLYTWDGSDWVETPNQYLNTDENRLIAANVINITGDDVYGLFAEEGLTPPPGCPSCPACPSGGGGGGGGDDCPAEEIPPAQSPECADDGRCAVNERCVSGICENINCVCGQAADHECVPYSCSSGMSCAACPQGQVCQTSVCTVPAGECAGDEDCPATQRCNAGGFCEDVTGMCGEVVDHKFVPYNYECGTEPGCPSCPDGRQCVNHKCVKNDLTCPSTGIVGDSQTCQAAENGGVCANCDVQITDPAGKIFYGQTDENGNFAVPLNLEGSYKVSLLKNGQPVKSIEIVSFPQAKPEEPEKPTVPGFDSSVLLWIILLLIALAALAIYFRTRKTK